MLRNPIALTLAALLVVAPAVAPASRLSHGLDVLYHGHEHHDRHDDGHHRHGWPGRPDHHHHHGHGW